MKFRSQLAFNDFLILDVYSKAFRRKRGKIGCLPDELAMSFFCYQVNARKDGSLFNNLFYLKVFGLSAVLGEELPYIVACKQICQTAKPDLKQLAAHTKILDQNMQKVKSALASIFYVATSMTRDDVGIELQDGYETTFLP